MKRTRPTWNLALAIAALALLSGACQSPLALRLAVERAAKKTQGVIQSQIATPEEHPVEHHTLPDQPRNDQVQNYIHRVMARTEETSPPPAPRSATSRPAPRPNPSLLLTAAKHVSAATRPGHPGVRRMVVKTQGKPAAGRSPSPAEKEILPTVRITGVTAARSAGGPQQPDRGAANQGLNADSPAQVRDDQLARLIVRLQRQLADRPTDAALRRDLLLLCVAGEQDAKARELAQSDPAAERLDSRFVDALIRWRDLENHRDPALAAEDLLAGVAEVRRVLAEQADLDIPRVVLVAHKVEGFGLYDRVPGNRLRAGVVNRAILYVELANFKSRLGDDRQYLTRLRQRAWLLSPAGKVVWHEPPAEITDRCRNRRNDFFTRQQIAIPATIPPGRYILKVYVEDLLAGKAAENSIVIHLTGSERPDGVREARIDNPLPSPRQTIN